MDGNQTSNGSARVELQRIAHGGDALVVTIGEGKSTWEVRCTATQLQKFDRFQAAVADQIGLWIEHNSQDARRARERAEDWQRAVGDAFSTGATK